MRVDSLIVASAKAAGASDFYTNDDNCRALANLVMNGRELPTKGSSGELFIDQLIEGDELEMPKPPRRKGRRKKS